MTWFERLTGIREGSPDLVRAQLTRCGSILSSRANGHSFDCGILEVPSLAELRSQVLAADARSGRPRVSECVGDVREMHQRAAHAGALFQVASQFNLLEMAGPDITPDAGVGLYEDDRTQGPACAIACGGGTIYRNYLVPVGDAVGQSRAMQLDMSADLGMTLGNTDARLWRMRNGYLLPTEPGLLEINSKLCSSGAAELQTLRGLLRIGIQWQAQVTLYGCVHRVSQAYCSALPVAYSRLPKHLAEPLARLVLEAAYEATLCVGALNLARTGDPRVFLTLLGGGVFGNERKWILDAIERAIRACRAPLEIAIVSYRQSDRAVAELAQSLQR